MRKTRDSIGNRDQATIVGTKRQFSKWRSSTITRISFKCNSTLFDGEKGGGPERTEPEVTLHSIAVHSTVYVYVVH